MKDRLGIIIGIAVILMVVLTMALWLVNVDEIGMAEIVLPMIILVIVVFAMYIVYDKLKNVQVGLPTEDERTVLLNYKASYYGFIAAIWSAVFGPTLYDIFYDKELLGRHVTALVVLCGGLVFVTSYLILQRKGVEA